MKQRTLKIIALGLSVMLGSLTVAAPALADGDHGGWRGDAGYHQDYRDRQGDRHDDHYRGDDDRGDWRADQHRRVETWRVRHEYRERANADYVAMAITTGVILSLFASQH